MKEILTTLRWIFGSIFTVTGLSFLFFAPIGGFLLLVLGIFLLPITLNLLDKKKRIPKAAKYTLPFLLFFASIFFSAKEMSAIAKETEHTSLVEKSQSVEYAEEVISRADDSTFAKYKRGEFTDEFIKDPELNDSFLSLLQENLYKRDSLLAEKERMRISDSINRVAIEAEKAKLRRQELIENQFSAWDGSHIALGRFIKRNMKNPDSYEHVETTYRDLGDHLIIQTKYRGTNSFNAVVPGSTTAKVTLSGKILEIL